MVTMKVDGKGCNERETACELRRVLMLQCCLAVVVGLARVVTKCGPILSRCSPPPLSHTFSLSRLVRSIQSNTFDHGSEAHDLRGCWPQGTLDLVSHEARPRDHIFGKPWMLNDACRNMTLLQN